MEYNEIKIGQRLKKIRTEIGMSQQALARALYVLQATLCKIERGYGLPSISTLFALAEFFNRKVSYLLCEDDSEIVTSNSMSL